MKSPEPVENTRPAANEKKQKITRDREKWKNFLVFPITFCKYWQYNTAIRGQRPKTGKTPFTIPLQRPPIKKPKTEKGTKNPFSFSYPWKHEREHKTARTARKEKGEKHETIKPLSNPNINPIKPL